jgi:SAM-dependent methyltransferase
LKIELLEILRCPRSGQRLSSDRSDNNSQDIESGWLISEDGKNRYPIHKGIPRFVPEINYADNFGMQWNHFRKTQLDSYSGHPISADRFWKSVGWRPVELNDRWVLDVGCGAGRFAEVALNAGAKVVALDYSNAVDACFSNLKHYSKFHVVQGDIYALPFASLSISFIYSLGVLQHTPDVARAFAALVPIVNEGGRICVDYYAKTWRSYLLPKYWFRPLTKRLPKNVLFSFLSNAVPLLLPVSRILSSIPIFGGWLKRVVPVANHYGTLPLDKKQQKEWSLLDTFDWFSPEYDNPQTTKIIKKWMENASMKEVKILKIGHLVARGKK